MIHLNFFDENIRRRELPSTFSLVLDRSSIIIFLFGVISGNSIFVSVEEPGVVDSVVN